MDRRTLLSAFGTSLLVASIAAKAQRGGKVARIGYLSTGTPTANAALHNAFIEIADGSRGKTSRSSTAGRTWGIPRSMLSRVNWQAFRWTRYLQRTRPWLWP